MLVSLSYVELFTIFIIAIFKGRNADETLDRFEKAFGEKFVFEDRKIKKKTIKKKKFEKKNFKKYKKNFEKNFFFKKKKKNKLYYYFMYLF